MKRLIFTALLCAGCAHHNSPLHVTGIRESQQAVREAQASSAATSREIADIKTTAIRVEAKDDIITQWEERQERRRHERP